MSKHRADSNSGVLDGSEKTQRGGKYKPRAELYRASR